MYIVAQNISFAISLRFNYRLTGLQVILNYGPQSQGMVGTLISWYDPVLTAHLAGWGVVTNGWCAYFFSPLCTSHL